MKTYLTEYRDLTQHQLRALTKEYNLADAHTHQSQSLSQQGIIERLPELWYESETLKQKDLEDRFINSFFTFRKQDKALETPTLLVYAASIAMVLLANFFKKKQLSVALLTPCFDNLFDILTHMQVPLEPVHENWLHNHSEIYTNLENNIKSDVIFIVTPNNPTAWDLAGSGDQELIQGFKELIRFCKDYNKMLAFDFCFSSFKLTDPSIKNFDVYKLLEESGVDYLCIEDTGKTWPLQDAKVSLIKTSKNLYEDIYNLHTAYLLNVSPFVLNLGAAYIENSKKDQCESIGALLERNRSIAKETMLNSLLEFQEPKVPVSVAWFKITNPKLKATKLQKYILEHKNVYVLPGTYFFWDDRERGEHYIRVALARDTEIFKTSIQFVREAIDELVCEPINEI